MERGLDQLIFFAFIVLAALVDWVVRVIRNRNAPPRPPVEEQEVEYFEDEAAYPEEYVQPRQSRAQPAPEPASREVVFDMPVPAEWRLAAFTAPAHAPQPPPAVRRTPPARSPAVNPHRWRREALGLRAPGAARRAIVMMAVLGPCRAREDQPRGW